jgi:hypothetical protein
MGSLAEGEDVIGDAAASPPPLLIPPLTLTRKGDAAQEERWRERGGTGPVR